MGNICRWVVVARVTPAHEGVPQQRLLFFGTAKSLKAVDVPPRSVVERCLAKGFVTMGQMNKY